MADRDFLLSKGWRETDAGWINRERAPFAAPMALKDAAKVQRFVDKLDAEPVEPRPRDPMNRAKVHCHACGREVTVNADWCVANGWPKCCGLTMSLFEGFLEIPAFERRQNVVSVDFTTPKDGKR